MMQVCRIHLPNWLWLGREADRSINKVARSGFDLAVNPAQVCTDDTKAQKLESPEEIHRENSRCPTWDSTIRVKDSPQYPAGDYYRPREHDEAKRGDNLQRHGGKRSYPIHR